MPACGLLVAAMAPRIMAAIIIGAWRRGAMAGLLRGHVAERVIGTAPCGVLVVTA